MFKILNRILNFTMPREKNVLKKKKGIARARCRIDLTSYGILSRMF